MYFAKDVVVKDVVVGALTIYYDITLHLCPTDGMPSRSHLFSHLYSARAVTCHFGRYNCYYIQHFYVLLI